ncbi:MAG: DNA polymerase III subunit delta [Bacteroidetes bacterium]|nr:DNA polymerase III subunit delta [Bacteroidota bacterium]
MTEQILTDWKKGCYKPLYWLEGEEEYWIDEAVHYAEHSILSEAEASFNLTVFYGRDAAWADIINACRRYPMFSERQVVLVKEAQHMREIEKLEPYFENPSASTLLVVSYKEKTLDKRTRFAKTVAKHAEVATCKKLYDDKIPEWTRRHVESIGLIIDEKAVMLIVEHIGNDLTRIVHEVDKLRINLKDRKNITEDDIESYIGISKEYNVFELQTAIGRKDLPKAIRIINYFGSNPKAGPMLLVLPILYNYFSKLYLLTSPEASREEKGQAALLGVNPFFLKDYLASFRAYGPEGVRKALLLLHHYNLLAIGMGSGGASDADLMREMVVKLVRG